MLNTLQHSLTEEEIKRLLELKKISDNLHSHKQQNTRLRPLMTAPQSTASMNPFKKPMQLTAPKKRVIHNDPMEMQLDRHRLTPFKRTPYD